MVRPGWAWSKGTWSVAQSHPLWPGQPTQVSGGADVDVGATVDGGGAAVVAEIVGDWCDPPHAVTTPTASPHARTWRRRRELTGSG